MPDILAINGGQPTRTKSFPTWPVFDKRDERAVLEVRSGKWGRKAGDCVTRFETAFAKYQGARFGVAVMNGTVAIRIALLAAGIEPGDEVIVPSYTFVATASAVIEANAVPIFVDIDPETYCMSLKDLKAKITSRTRMMIPVHFAGLPADMNPIMEIALTNNLTVIEDAAQAHGAEYKGKRVGAIGHLGCFSFQSSKNLSAGEGGIILTNNELFERLARSMHTCGRYPEGAWYDHFILGGNYRMTEFQAALLLNQLRRLEEQTETREQNGKYLNLKLKDIPGIRPLVRKPENIRHSYHLFIFKYDAKTFAGATRNRFLCALTAEGIPNLPGYAYPLHRQPMFLNQEIGHLKDIKGVNIPAYGEVSCPESERACYQEACWLPQSLLLGTKDDMDDIIRAVLKIYEHREDINPVKAGTAQIKITPDVGIELCGYVERVQPSIGILDDLYVRSLYLESGSERLLWLHSDLISINRDQLDRLRETLFDKYGLFERQIVLTASHTHSGPATIDLRFCGCMDGSYLEDLQRRLMAAAEQSMSDTHLVSAGFFEGTCSLARDRRNYSAFQHVDQRLPVISFRGKNGKFVAVLANYGMHNVALSARNRYISADVSGGASALTSQNLPGNPVVIVTNGASANTVPPQVSADPGLMQRYAQLLSNVIVQSALSTRHIVDEDLFSEIAAVNLPLDILSFQQISRAYDKACSRFEKKSTWIDAINFWRDETLRLLETNPPESVSAIIQTIRIGPIVFSAISAEVFSRMAEELRKICGSSHYVVGCTNGNIGYLPFEEIYTEGGYEVDSAFMFYSNFKIARGGHEKVRDTAIRMAEAATATKNTAGERTKSLEILEERQ